MCRNCGYYMYNNYCYCGNSGDMEMKKAKQVQSYLDIKDYKAAQLRARTFGSFANYLRQLVKRDINAPSPKAVWEIELKTIDELIKGAGGEKQLTQEEIKKIKQHYKNKG